jgi:uncharacterized protein (DUF433 family)
MKPTLTIGPSVEPSSAIPPLARDHIVSTSDTCGGKPRINGTRIRVKDIVLWHERIGMSPEQIVSEWSHLTLGDVYAALSYYDDNRARFDAEMKAEEEFAADLEAKTSLTAAGLIKSPDASDDTVPPR